MSHCWPRREYHVSLHSDALLDAIISDGQARKIDYATESLHSPRFSGAGVGAAVLPLMFASPLSAQTAETVDSAADRKLFLFLDWFHVQKGELKVTLDPHRISEAGKKTLEMYARDFGKKFDQSGHGFKSDAPFGVRIVQETAQHGKRWIVADRPWEERVSSPTVLFDEGRFRCWYVAQLKGESQSSTVDQERAMELTGSALAYAESSDGLNWTKPSLEILSYRGSCANNLVSPYCNGGSVFRDDHGRPEERYKGFQFDELPKEEVSSGDGPKARYGLYGVYSPDGYRWTKNPKPLIRYFADTTNIATWDPQLQKYVGFFRHHLSGRAISRAETEDFWNWPEPQPFLYAGPMDGPADDYYTSCYTPYPGQPSLRLLFPAIYHHDNDSVDVRVGVSRDGRAFQWISRKPIIKLGAPGEWDCGTIYAQPQLVQLPDGRLALPYNGYNTTHNEVWFKNFYGDYDSESGIGWALWKDSRLAGIEADNFGEFAMYSTSIRGDQVQINARTARAGSVEVELRQGGRPLKGFAFADCAPFSGDAIWAPCRWKDKANVAELKGKHVEVRFRLRSAKIFACRFV